jgi:choline dehydrogenase-like flavoprotein
MPQGKVLGGGSILNAMCWNRGGSDDFDAWEALGNPGWGWDGILPYFMKVNASSLKLQTGLTMPTERNIHSCSIGRDRRRILHPLQSCSPWHLWACPSQLP